MTTTKPPANQPATKGGNQTVNVKPTTESEKVKNDG